MEVETDAEYLTTSPVCLIRICIAFYQFEMRYCTNQPPGMIQEGGISPLLGRFKGDCKGGEIEIPPLPFFLSTVNGAFFLMLRKKAGLKTPRLRRGGRTAPARGVPHP